MIELTEEQLNALKQLRSTSARFVNPKTKEIFMLVQAEEYVRLTEAEYDDNPWTKEEFLALAWQAGKSIGWEDMDEYDNFPENL